LKIRDCPPELTELPPPDHEKFVQVDPTFFHLTRNGTLPSPPGEWLKLRILIVVT
jgi:hypothetical protein